MSGEPGARPHPRSFAVRPIPENAPRIISADEACARGLINRVVPLPDPHPLVSRLAQAVIEVVSGQRPPAQLIRHLAPTVYSVVARRALVAARRQQPGARRAAVVRRVRLCEPTDGVVEACAVVVAHGRVRAMAMRLEGIDGRWVVTAITIG